VVPPTQENIRKLEQPKKRAHMQGNIMDSMLHPKGVLGAGGIQLDKKPPRSQAFSTGSAFSHMKTGAFFKMVDSPFKASIMNAYDKM